MGDEQCREPDAVRVLRGENARLVAGMSFVPLGALKALRWGGAHRPIELMSAVAGELQLDFVFVPAVESWAGQVVDRLRSSDTASFWVVDGPFGVAARRLGWAETLRLSAADPDALAPQLDEALDATIDGVREGISSGASAIVIADDLAGNAGPLVAPDFVNEELLPRLARAVLEAERSSLPSVLHSDGDVRVFLPAMARAGFSAVHGGGLGEEAFVRTLRDARTAGLRVIGGIEGEALRAGVPAAIRAGTQTALFAVPGDLLVADDGSVSTGEEFSAFVAALNAARGRLDALQGRS